MDETEFRRLLDLFPVVRSRHYQAESESSRPLSLGTAEDEKELKEWQDAWDKGDQKETETEGGDRHDVFWTKLKLVAERKMGAAEAEKFCKAFQKAYKKLVYEELSLDAAQRFVNASK